VEDSATGQALLQERLIQPRSSSVASLPARVACIQVRRASANNLKGVDVEIPKGKLTVVTGLSGSGKSSLVHNVLEAAARRRYLETLSMYERQGIREGPEAPVDSVTGLGVTLTVDSLQAHTWSALSHFTRRASVGRATELSHHLHVLLSLVGHRHCPECGTQMARGEGWLCAQCGATAAVAQPRHFSTENYASACDACTGVGILLEPQPEKLIVRPDKPLCAGAMYSPGYWPQTYLCQDTGVAQALGARYGFDPSTTPWQEMSEEARQAFLFGDPEPLVRTYRSKGSGRLKTVTQSWEGFYGGWVRDWDVHGTYTKAVTCPGCGGSGLRPEYLAVTLSGQNVHTLSEMPLDDLAAFLEDLSPVDEATGAAKTSLKIMRRRLRFMRTVGLGYLTLNRPSGTLSAGEAQRIQLAGLLGSGLTSLTVLLDEPSRGMHPSELEALREALQELRNGGNTLVVVEHDPILIRAADHVIDMGPSAGRHGGEIVATGTPYEIASTDTHTGRWLRREGLPGWPEESQAHSGPSTREARERRLPRGWLVIEGARANNLRGETIQLPLGTLVGICGVSGSGKSTLLLDTLGRALVRQKHSTSFAQEPSQPGEYESIEGAPARTILVDQARKGVQSPAAFLGLAKPLAKLYADSPDARALGLDEKRLVARCSACKGRGLHRIEMGFLPDLFEKCETCRGTGFLAEAWDVHVHGVSLPEVNALTLQEVYDLFFQEPKMARPLEVALEVGLGYLVWRQPGHTLSGGEVQRLKIVKELCRRTQSATFYILDEPTVGLHMEDVANLVGVLHRLVDAGHTVAVIEHHAHVLAACDWLVELGPGGGPQGGRVVAAGKTDEIAMLDTPTAPYLRTVLEVWR
jgi:excinuclease ABC subunit A